MIYNRKESCKTLIHFTKYNYLKGLLDVMNFNQRGHTTIEIYTEKSLVR
jgi:hypothetical protein